MSWWPAPLAVKAAREINPALQIGCMIAMCPIYPLTCAPDDMMMAMNAMHRRYWFTDVHVRGRYPQHLLNYFAPPRLYSGYHRSRSSGVNRGLCRLHWL